VNTNFYWEAKMGVFAMLSFLLLIVYFFVLTILFFGQIYFSIREKFKNRQRLFVLILMTIVLVLCFLYPSGLINVDELESDSIFIAQREGVANCTTTLKLREDNSFIETNVCFGVTETTGTYKIKGDTIIFENSSLGRHESKFYKFAVIKNRKTKNEKHFGDLVRYKDYSDTIGTALWIIKNDLTK
jgi:hypothetical protein